MIKPNQLRSLGRTLITGFLVIQILFGYAGIGQVNFARINVAEAQLIKGPLNTNTPAKASVTEYKGVDESIKSFLCVPDDTNLGTALYDCIGKIYRFGIAFGAIALVFFIVFAGYLYMVGGESSKEKGKTIFTTALTGMAIILSSYVLLNFINPNLTKIRPIQAPIFSASSLPKCVDVGYGVNCVLPNGQVQNVGGGGGTIGRDRGCPRCMSGMGSADYFKNTCVGANAEAASFVVAAESSCGRNIYNTTDLGRTHKDTGTCADGSVVMIGLFQINITAHELAGLNCPAAFSGGAFTRNNKSCRIKDPDLYKKCKDAASNPNTNITEACEHMARLKGKSWYPNWGGSACWQNLGLKVQ